MPLVHGGLGLKRSLRLSLTLLIAVVAVAPAVVGGLLLYWGARAEVREQVLGRMDAIADRTSTSIGQVMAERLGDAETFASRAYVRERCARLIDGRPAPGETPRGLQEDLSAQLESVTTVFGHYVDGVIVDLRSGRPIAWQVPAGGKPDEIVRCAELASGTEIADVRMAPAHFHVVSRRPVVGVVAPIRRPAPGGAHSPAPRDAWRPGTWRRASPCSAGTSWGRWPRTSTRWW